MAHATFFDIYWVTIDSSIESHLLNEPSKLANICAKKLVSDVSLIRRYCLKLPKSIHSLMFSTAILEERTLSIEQLMKYCSQETLELPIPGFFKFIQSFFRMKGPELELELRSFERISMTMLSVFFDIIKQNNNIVLQTLDLGILPLRSAALQKICHFLLKEKVKIPFLSKTYTLNFAVEVESCADFSMLQTCVENTTLGFNLNITGMYFCNFCVPDTKVRRLFFSQKPNLQLIAFNFCSLVPNFDLFFDALQNFRFLKYLNLSYLPKFLTSEREIRKLACGLIELPNLERLVLKAIQLTDSLKILFLEYCKRNRYGASIPNCCLVHNGILHFLELSSCKLSIRDLDVLKEISLTNALSYLDISGNALQERRTFEILLFFKSSLQALNICSCFLHCIDYDAAVMPFSAFTQLKYLNIGDLQVSENSKHFLKNELQKMTSVEVNAPPYLLF